MIAVAAIGCIGMVAVVAKGNDDSKDIPMTEERIATELLGNPVAARCTIEQLEEADIPPDVLEALVADETGGREDGGIGTQVLDQLDEAQSIMWGCMAAPTSGDADIGGTLADLTSAAPSDVGNPADTIPDPDVVVVDGQPPIYNATPVWAPEPGTVTVLDDGSAVIAERSVTVVVPFEHMPERATNRG